MAVTWRVNWRSEFFALADVDPLDWEFVEPAADLAAGAAGGAAIRSVAEVATIAASSAREGTHARPCLKCLTSLRFLRGQGSAMLGARASGGQGRKRDSAAVTAVVASATWFTRAAAVDSEDGA